MGCSGSKTGGEVVDYKNVSPFNSNYPPPVPSTQLKRQIYGPEDTEAIQQKLDKMPKGVEGSYSRLLKHLCLGESDVRKVRAIFAWMGTQDFNSTALMHEKPADTPLGYQRMIKEKTGNISTYFAILCRRAGVPCVIINGLGKDPSYEIGLPEDNMACEWNAVYIEGEWRLVHAGWGTKKNNSGQIYDHFFLTDPGEFAVTCLPDDYRWQLLNQPLTKKQFLALPNIKSRFFDMDMFVVKPKTGTSRVPTGLAEVELGISKSLIQNVIIKYKLQLLQKFSETDNEEDTEASLNNLERYVFMNRKTSRFVFEIVLPQPGKYVFDLHGEMSEGSGGIARLCQFRFISEKRPNKESLEPLPDAPDIGWGPGPRCRQLGLIPLTHFDGCIYIKPGEAREVRFRTVGDLDVEATLFHNDIPSEELEDIIKFEVEDNEARVLARVPEEGQFALKIYVRQSGTSQFQEACNYLLRQHLRGKYSEKHRDRMIRAELEKHLKENTSEKKLRDALAVFECYRVPDQGEKKRTEEKLAQYWLIKKELDAAVKRRHLGNLNRWIARAHQSRYKSDLQDEISQAEKCEENVKRLKGYLHPIARMDENTILEIRTYHRPPPVIRDVMTGTYVLLGEDSRDLEDWEYIQYLMSRTGKDSLQRRILDRRQEDVPDKVMQQADNILKPHNLQSAREASTGTATFYRWAHQFVQSGRRKRLSVSEDGEHDSYMDKSNLDSGWDTSRELTDTYRDKESQRESDVTANTEEEHPFGVHQEDGPKTSRNFLMTASAPKQGEPERPESYAGFKP